MTGSRYVLEVEADDLVSLHELACTLEAVGLSWRIVRGSGSVVAAPGDLVAEGPV